MTRLMFGSIMPINKQCFISPVTSGYKDLIQVYTLYYSNTSFYSYTNHRKTNLIDNLCINDVTSEKLEREGTKKQETVRWNKLK